MGNCTQLPTCKWRKYNNWDPNGEPNDYDRLGGEDYGHIYGMDLETVNGMITVLQIHVVTCKGYIVEYGGSTR